MRANTFLKAFNTFAVSAQRAPRVNSGTYGSTFSEQISWFFQFSALTLFTALFIGIMLIPQVSATTTPSLSLDYSSSYPLPGPVNVTATIIAGQPFNGTIEIFNAPNFLNVLAVHFDDSSFVVNDATSVKTTVTLSLSASDVGAFTLNLSVTNDSANNSPIITSAPLASSFYYNAAPQVISAKVVPNATNSSNLLVQFETDIPSSCRFDFVPTTYSQAVFSLYIASQNNTVHTYSLSNAKQKEYTFYVVCQSLASQITMVDPYIFAFNVTRNPPTVLSYQPSVVNGGTGLQLSLQTDVPSECKYDSSDKTYDYLANYFDYVFSTNHQALIPLASTPIQIYIRCADKVSNVMDSSFVVNYATPTAPSGVIDISDYISGNYLTDGLHTITLTTTPLLASAPGLDISYITAGGIRSVKIPMILASQSNPNGSLTGVGATQTYTGTLQILPDEFSGVAYFDFDGVDLLGNHGNQLTGETSVIVLASNPNPVASVDVKQLASAGSTNSNGFDEENEISWSYTPDAYFDHYEIQKYYSSDLTTPISDRATTATDVTDSDLIDGKTYVYAISVVNRALKKSTPTLSSPITVTQQAANSSAATNAQNSQNPQSSSTSTAAQYSMPQYLSDNLIAIQTRLDNLLTELRAVNSTPLFSLIGAGTNNANIIGQIDSTISDSRKKVYGSNQEVSDQINALLQQETIAKQQFIMGVRIVDSQSQKQSLSKDDYSLIFAQYLAAKRWDGDAKEFDSVLSQTEDSMSKLTITQHTSLLGVTYYNGAQDLRTYISKDIIGPVPAQSQLYEYTSDETPQALWDNADYQRLVKFIVIASTDNVSYYFQGSVPPNETSQFKTIFFPLNPFDSSASTTGNFFATDFSLGSVLYYILGLLAIVLLGVYYATGSATSMFDTAALAAIPKKITGLWSGGWSRWSSTSSSKKSRLAASSSASLAASASESESAYAIGNTSAGNTIAVNAGNNDFFHSDNLIGKIRDKNEDKNDIISENKSAAVHQDEKAAEKNMTSNKPAAAILDTRTVLRNADVHDLLEAHTLSTHSLADVTLDPKEFLSFSARTPKVPRTISTRSNIVRDSSDTVTIDGDIASTRNANRDATRKEMYSETENPRGTRDDRSEENRDESEMLDTSRRSLTRELNATGKKLSSLAANNPSLQKVPFALKDYQAPPHLCFVTCEGRRISTLLELAFELSQMKDEVFAHHVNDSKHDFAIWIKDVFGLPKHAWVLKEIKEKHALAQAIFMLVEGGFANE